MALSVRVHPSSLKHDCDRGTTNTGKVPTERTREVTLDSGVSTDTPVIRHGPGGSLPEPGAGHPLQVRSSILPTAADSNRISQQQASAVGSTQGHSHVAWRLGDMSGLKAKGRLREQDGLFRINTAA